MLVDVFERFTDRARRVLVLAQEEARLLGHGYIGTEHILLGLLHDGHDVAARALGSLGIEMDNARREVLKILGPQVRPGARAGSPPFTPRAKKVLELSLREALQLGHNYISTEHFLLGLLREGEGVAVQTLTALGVDLADVRQRVKELLAGRPEESHSHRPASYEPAGAGPRCPTCRAVLKGNVAYKILPVNAAEGPGGATDPGGTETIDVLFVYCQLCKVMLAHTAAKEVGSDSPSHVE